VACATVDMRTRTLENLLAQSYVETAGNSLAFEALLRATSRTPTNEKAVPVRWGREHGSPRLRVRVEGRGNWIEESSRFGPPALSARLVSCRCSTSLIKRAKISRGRESWQPGVKPVSWRLQTKSVCRESGAAAKAARTVLRRATRILFC